MCDLCCFPSFSFLGHCGINIQRCAAHWVGSSRWNPSVFSWTKSLDQLCLYLLGWPSLSLHRDYLSVTLLYDIINNKIAVKH